MKPQPNPTRTRSYGTKGAADEAARCLQEELVAAVHGAFGVALEMVVGEVKQIVSLAAKDMYEELQRENLSLKHRLHRAEALRDSDLLKGEEGGRGGADSPPADLLSNFTNDPPPQDCSHMTSDPALGSSLPAGPPAEQHENHVNRDQEQRSHVNIQCVNDAMKEQSNGCPEETSHMVKIESTKPPCRGSPPRLHIDSMSTSEQVTVKKENPDEENPDEENPDEESDGSSCSLDLIKMEDFSLQCLSAAQSQMLEDWKPEVPDQVSGLDPEFPNIFQLSEPAPVPEAASQVGVQVSGVQVSGVQVRASRNLSHSVTDHSVSTFYACKSCGQTFHLPSLLRRHHAQCQKKLQQPASTKKARLQLYPPGCSPFRCHECNREFNRMENLKTHLRIHTGERPFVCSVCSKCFRHSGALTRHFRIHTGEKPYVCTQCGKSFRNCGGLKFHQRAHSKQLHKC
ncbi:zinc finger protein 79-like [Brachyistius frenatus]|uniref:zinc finger protein 79-like n=1 Tax=Brachyistius frenatus TaxID=100188 RepID=UPI0037E728EA